MTQVKGLLAAALVILTWSTTPAESPKVVKFSIKIDHLVDGLALECSEGCAWKSLKIGGCIPGERCQYQLNQYGMEGPVREPT